jgi:hypothetical protein
MEELYAVLRLVPFLIGTFLYILARDARKEEMGIGVVLVWSLAALVAFVVGIVLLLPYVLKFVMEAV